VGSRLFANAEEAVTAHVQTKNLIFTRGRLSRRSMQALAAQHVGVKL
jgi:hypothetical protein